MDFEHDEAVGELLALQKRIAELENQNDKLKYVIKENDLEDEIEDIDCTSLEEQICSGGIRHIASLVESQDYDDKDIKSFQILYNTLRAIRGAAPSTKKTKVADVAELLKIVGKSE